MAVESTAGSLSRSWRTAFLTLRDETLNYPGGVPSTVLLHDAVLVHSQSLIAAAAYLPRAEVTSDLMYLLNLALMISPSSEDVVHAYAVICHLVHDVALCIPLEFSSSAWIKLLDSFGKLVKVFLRNAEKKSVVLENDVMIEAITNCVDTTRHLMSFDHLRCSVSENVHLVKFLFHLVASPHAEYGSHCSVDQRCAADSVVRMPRHSSLWKVHTTVFSMIGDAFSRVGSSFPTDIWQFSAEALRIVMDSLASKRILIEDPVVSKFYASVLTCLHQVLVNRKGPIVDHVPSFVAALKLFLNYGVGKFSPWSSDKRCWDQNSFSASPIIMDSTREKSGLYRPPHLRRKNGTLKQLDSHSSRVTSGHDSSGADFSSSDSDYSDNDVTSTELAILHRCKARVAAITCIRDLCEADPKAFTAQWMMLLPTVDVLHPRKNDATLMSCLLLDPHMTARLASASAIAIMLDGPASLALQAAEYRDSAKCGSFLAFSSSLGQMLMQLHTGVLYLIQKETHTGLLTALFKILMLLLSSTPYSRMPEELLAEVLSSLHKRINVGFQVKGDQSGLQALALSCQAAALSASPPSFHISQMLQTEISCDLVLGLGPGILATLFQLAERATRHTISYEALQALRAVGHNYPNIMVGCWKQVSAMVHGFLRPGLMEVASSRTNVGNGVGSLAEKVLAAAVKVLDECLRALSGFRGTDDGFGDTFVDTPFTSDCVRDKKISSAPAHTPESLTLTKENSKQCPAGSMEWHETMAKHIPLAISHTSIMVRAASFNCFAGITLSVFSSLKQENQEFILSSCISAAARDEAPLVRSAACRAIGVIAFFPAIFVEAQTLHKLINAVDICSRHSLISVRVPASWAMANMCYTLRHMDFQNYYHVLISFSERALLLTKDGDKVKSNAVRALGNISRMIPFSSKYKPDCCKLPSMKHGVEGHHTATYASNGFSPALSYVQLLDGIVQAFLSCISTGSVKVQWNVCHALSNLFLNETIRMEHMDWAPSVYSILLVLLRDSSNFKIRIQAAQALAVPSTVLAYGRSFSDVVQGVELILENLGSEQNLMPSNFKYKVALEKQLTSTMLHLIGLCPSNGYGPLDEFLVKKVSFFEEWFKRLMLSLEGGSSDNGNEVESNRKQKKGLISSGIRSLVLMYEGKDQPACARRLEKVLNCLS
ncbi:hypothetical protein Droror1_Dr00022946 [Drosera rotundifolia]